MKRVDRFHDIAESNDRTGDWDIGDDADKVPRTAIGVKAPSQNTCDQIGVIGLGGPG